MQNSSNLTEKRLHEVWLSQNFISQLKTLSGEEIVVLDAGIYNEDAAGPDFKNARIRIGNLVYVGDVEIDSDYFNWKSHGHNIDNKHNKVILHASFVNRNGYQYVYTKDGRRVPSICLSNFIDSGLIKKSDKEFVDIPEANHMRCSHLSSQIDFITKKKFIANLGLERFDKKCQKVKHRLKELMFLKEMHIKEPAVKYDLKPEFENAHFEAIKYQDHEIWQQLFYENVFEALGYTKNKNIMQRLAQNVDIPFLKKLGNDRDSISRYESALFNVAGLLPDKSTLDNSSESMYIQKLYEDWEIISRIYDGEKLENSEWHFLRLRPQNFPTIRIAGGIRFLDLLLFEDILNKITRKFSEINNLNILINSLRSVFVIKSFGFWKKHYVFNQPANDEIKYFIGASRADEILVNVVLPFYYVYFEILSEEELQKKILKIYNIFDQKSDNKIVREVAEALSTESFLRKTILSQGLIELFRNYCSKKKCLDCTIGKLIFN